MQYSPYIWSTTVETICIWENRWFSPVFLQRRTGVVRLAHTDCLWEKQERKRNQFMVCVWSPNYRSMGCAASRTPVGENRTRRFPPSMKNSWHQSAYCMWNPSPTAARTHFWRREGDVHKLQAFSRWRVHACIGFQRSGQICTLQKHYWQDVLHASALTLLQRSFITRWVLGSGYVVLGCTCAGGDAVVLHVQWAVVLGRACTDL